MPRQAKPDGSTRVVRSHKHEYIWEKRDGKWRLQHRLVMEDKLGRPLATREHVHHMNGDTLDNRPENLTLVSPRAHAKHHKPERKPVRPRIKCARDGCRNSMPASEGKRYCSAKCRFYATRVTVTCPACGGRFIAYRSQRRRFCSRTCARKYEASTR
jgi:hypothetical protein